jgi:hypothetical protein
MKRLATLIFCAAGMASAADLTEVHNVYLLKMSKGFDQFLANRITGGRVFQVVTDPKLADTIITEQIGEAFQAKFDELFPPPEAEKPAKPEKTEKTEDAGDAGLVTDTVNKLSSPVSAFSRAKGMVFLVDAKSKQVIWSAYGLPKDSTSKELDRTANDIVSRIKHDLKTK